MPWYGFNIEDTIVISKSTSINLKSGKCVIHREVDNRILGKYDKNSNVIWGYIL